MKDSLIEVTPRRSVMKEEAPPEPQVLYFLPPNKYYLCADEMNDARTAFKHPSKQAANFLADVVSLSTFSSFIYFLFFNSIQFYAE